MKEEQNKRKEIVNLEVETESVCLMVSDRMVPEMLSLLSKVDFLLTI